VSRSRELAAAVKFVIVGVANSTVGLLAIYMFKWQAGFGDVAANASGYAVGLGLSFVLNRAWTFRHAGPKLRALVRFLLVFVVAYSFNLAALIMLLEVFHVSPYVAHALSLVPYTIVFYLGARHFAFRLRATDIE
jgi:putative flippase GtrA